MGTHHQYEVANPNETAERVELSRVLLDGPRNYCGIASLDKITDHRPVRVFGEVTDPAPAYRDNAMGEIRLLVLIMLARSDHPRLHRRIAPNRRPRMACRPPHTSSEEASNKLDQPEGRATSTHRIQVQDETACQSFH